jgi:hypothetical protein
MRLGMQELMKLLNLALRVSQANQRKRRRKNQRRFIPPLLNCTRNVYTEKVRFPRKAETPIEKEVGEDREVTVETTYVQKKLR